MINMHAQMKSWVTPFHSVIFRFYGNEISDMNLFMFWEGGSIENSLSDMVPVQLLGLLGIPHL